MNMSSKNLQVCSRCVYDETLPNITFDADGVCNYCHQIDLMDKQYPNGEEGKRRLAAIVEDIKKAGRGNKYDCIVGVSGGTDSSYLLYLMIEMGLRPLAVHFDNTYNSPIATQNIYNVLDKLKVDLFTYVVDCKEFDDIYRAFLRSGVKETDAATDIGLTSTMYMAAEKYGVEYIIEGHSFRTEGVAPLGWAYMDGKFIEDIHDKFGTMKRKTFPNLTLLRFIRWAALGGYKRIRPLYYLDYDKEATKKLLEEKLGWVNYGGHHLENRISCFCHTYLLPYHHNSDQRLLGHAALVRSGQLDRSAALEELSHMPEYDPRLVAMIRKRLQLSEAEFLRLTTQPKKHFSAYKTYKPTFERLRWFFWLLYKLNRVPKSFYDKFAATKLSDLKPKQAA